MHCPPGPSWPASPAWPGRPAAAPVLGWSSCRMTATCMRWGPGGRRQHGRTERLHGVLVARHPVELSSARGRRHAQAAGGSSQLGDPHPVVDGGANHPRPCANGMGLLPSRQVEGGAEGWPVLDGVPELDQDRLCSSGRGVRVALCCARRCHLIAASPAPHSSRKQCPS